MNNKQLCPKCRISAEIYQLDPKIAVCPYMQCHTGKDCSFSSSVYENEVNDDERV